MNQYRFHVRGSSGQYEVTFTKEGDQVMTSCTCQAGEHGLHCKHRIAIIMGDSSNILSENESQVETIKEMIKGTILEKALVQFEQARKACDLAQTQLSKAKKALAKAMNGRND